MNEHLNIKKIKLVTRKISFLMEHQVILPDLKEIILEALPNQIDKEINYDSPEFLMGAQSALLALLSSLEQKGSNDE